MPRALFPWLDYTENFYTTALEDANILARLARLKITTEELQETQAMIAAVRNSKLVHRNEIAESQEATRAKDKALAELDEWMRDFYDMAKIALEDSPQMMESLGVFVRN
ncbi:hypothetical protein [Sediminitomix flava]|uniref:Uncharacterized protein n=1 Tax=Sediminitomix flava TaxID=379075 RepID=A0A315Z941_SEDFL|nr:hypothetical protein [Sediminitomix flava]PWJ40046.1 hypothetical protein BC781_105109 [Sediminitomix flava]